MAEVIYRHRKSFNISAKDGVYTAEICEVYKRYKAWELDRNNDTSMPVTVKTGEYRVRFFPVVASMKLPEDLKRKRVYEMTGENIVKMYDYLERNVQYWFALDMAELHSK